MEQTAGVKASERRGDANRDSQNLREIECAVDQGGKDLTARIAHDQYRATVDMSERSRTCRPIVFNLVTKRERLLELSNNRGRRSLRCGHRKDRFAIQVSTRQDELTVVPQQLKGGGLDHISLTSSGRPDS